MKKILIPTDFSKNAENAIRYAFEFINQDKAEIHFIHVIEPTLLATDLPTETSQLVALQMKSARKNLTAIELRCQEYSKEGKYSNLSCLYSIHAGSTTHTIKEFAINNKVDLIIMGTKGRNNFISDRLLGSVSTSVIKMAPCPVMLIPQNYAFKPINNVTYATNLNHIAPFEIWRATEVLFPHVAIIRCLFVAKNNQVLQNKDFKKFAKYLTEHSPSIQTIFDTQIGSNIDEIIIQYSEIYDTEMIIMLPSKKGWVKNLMTSSHTKTITFLSQIPILIMDLPEAN